MVLSRTALVRRLAAPLLTLVGLLAGRPACAAELVLGATSGPMIDPRIFGVNYVWHLTPASAFATFQTQMRDTVHASLIRYPGGWAAEWLDWARNEEVGGEAHPEQPGIDADQFLADVLGTDEAPVVTFVTPSAAAIRDPARTQALVQAVVGLVQRYGGRVKTWEIGNEWWLQRGAKANPALREQNLAAYAALVSQLVPAMHAADPAIEIYATGDWTQPDEFATLRHLIGPTWDTLSGVSVHPYCGTLEAQTLCSLLPQRAEAIREITGKTRVYASEWSLGHRVNADSFGIRNANLLVTAIRTLAEARLSAASYWPAAGAVPGISLISADTRRVFANGKLFGWMAQYFRGALLPVSGDLPGAAARSADGATVFVASMGEGARRVRLRLAGSGMQRLLSAEVLYSEDPNDPVRSRLARFAALPARLVGTDVIFDINPGTPGRGAGWEIARVSLQSK